MSSQTFSLTRAERKAVLRRANASHITIQIIPGIALAPREVGESFHYETRGGRRISHPSAYSKRGWSNMVYCHSTRRVIVGSDWIRPTA